MSPEELAFAGIARQAELVRGGEVTSADLVELSLERIARLDPELNAFRIVFADRARAEAAQADARRGAGDSGHPLLGVPVAVKDNVHVAGEVTANGSNAHGGERASADSEVVRRLRAAGAIVIGKTHMSELAIFPFTETAAFGRSHNPWDRAHSAGGSSGGSGVAVAAGLVGAAYASDGGGSIRIPASTCGLFGLKPQRGRVSLAPDPQHWHGLSSAGCVSRRVADTALWLDAVAGAAPGDADTPSPLAGSFVEAASREPGKLRVALSFKPSSLARVDERVRRAVSEVADVLRGLGHKVRERDPDYGELTPLFLPRWMRGIYDDVREMPRPDLLERRSRRLAALGRLVGERGVARARAAEAARARQINEVFSSCDVLLTPTITAPPDPLGRFEGRSLATTILGAAQLTPFTTPWNVTGQPAASVPAPVPAGELPIGAQLVGRPEDEATLLSLATQLEREIGWAELRPPGD
jgi:amidase